MPIAEPKVFIIILNWNGKVDTLACLNSLKKSTYFNQEIVVIDNGSSDDSVEQIKLLYPSVTMLETGKNLGYAEGNNVGIRFALEHHADYVLLLNNDTTVAIDLLDQLVNAAQQNLDTGVFGATLLYMDQPDTVWFAGAQWNAQSLSFDYPYQDQTVPENLSSATDYACGAALFFRTEVARSIGLLDARFFLVCEESDWCLRATRAGFGCKLVPSAYVWHKVGASFDGESSPLRQYFSFRNRLLWAEKNLSLTDLLYLIKDSFNPFCPQFTISKSENAPFIKRLVWAIIGCKINWFSPILRAKRRGIMDYFFRNFGDCPESIRALNKTYNKEQIKNKSII
jgi:GT2 family glycosyltransferase